MIEQSIRVLLVDDHPMFLEGIRANLGRQTDISIIAEAMSGEDAIEKTAKFHPDVICLDIGLPKMNGLDVAKVLRKNYSKSKILVLSMQNQREYVERFLNLGVKGYVVKDAPPAELVEAIRSISKGKVYIGNGIKSSVLIDEKPLAEQVLPDCLSERELEVLNLISVSSKNKDIALVLGISVRTVEKHRSRIMRKLGIDNVAGLIRYLQYLDKN